MIKDILTNKDSKEKSRIKSQEISKLNHKGTYDDLKYGVRVEIQSLKAIEINGSHGVEIMARAWKGNKQLGFGNGSVEIERFRIFNPPIRVPDGTTRDKIRDDGSIVKIDNFKEDPIEAIKLDLAHTISIVGKENTEVIKGSIGNTTSTFYPDADPESTSVDGSIHKTGVNATWASLQGAADGTTVRDDVADVNAIQLEARGSTSGTWGGIGRAFFLFNTSAIPDTDTVDTATLSFFIPTGGIRDNATHNQSVVIVSSNPATNTALVVGDYSQVGTTAFATAVDFGALTVNAYNGFAFNADGKAAVSKTGVSKFAGRLESDRANVEPSWADAVSDIEIYFAETADVTSDPKLVVVHSVAATKISPLPVFLPN